VFSLIRTRAPREAWDVRAVMEGRRRRVLAGASLVFSRVFPLEANPRTHPLWRLAEQFGAACGEVCGEGTTHVVATHGGTEKARRGRARRRAGVRA
jgi:RNA polymerase II C-terminal domain phosphatase-like 3/4